MSSALVLSQIRSEHLPAIIALHRSAMEGFITGIDQDKDEGDLRDIERFYFRDGGDFFVGSLDGQVVAMGGLKRHTKTTAEIKRMRIDKLHQGRGFGTQLLAALEQRAIDLGIQTLHLQTASTRVLAMKFYRKHGYEQVGQGRYGDVETTRFAKSINASRIVPLEQATANESIHSTAQSPTGIRP